MTLNQIATTLYRFSVGGYFNHEKWTKGQLLNFLRHWFGQADGIDRITPDACGWRSMVMEIALPDGWWLMSVWQLPDGSVEYNIPETREQDARWYPDMVKALGR